MKKTMLALALMLRVFYTLGGETKSGVVVGGGVTLQGTGWVIARGDDGKLDTVGADRIKDSRWEDVKP
jgi:hypothetical protein